MLRSPRVVAAVLVAALLGVSGVLLWTAGSGAAPTKSQTLFRKSLLADAKTTSGVKVLLEDGSGFVAPEIAFSDLTGDGRLDAVVLVETGGAAGAVALYLFSTHGMAADSALRVVYRSQRLYRASTEISGSTLVLRTPRYAAGDDVCCPAKVLERSYSWSQAVKTLLRRSARVVDGPA